MSVIQNIPLQQLQISELNARKTGGEKIDDLLASIAADGLLQNLTVTRESDDIYMVVAGGRRLRALQQLAHENRLSGSLATGIPCRVVDSDVALDASTAENTIREQMHPADEIDAYVGMAGKGKSDLEIAVRFGQSERHVAGMRKLGGVSPVLLQALRRDELSLDQVKAFTTTDDHGLQERVFENLDDWNNEPSDIRRMLNQEVLHIKSRLARFVTVEAYEGAGGVVRRDLFGDDAWLEDHGLAERLALEKLERRAAKERKKGWGWVEVSLEDPATNKLRRAYEQSPEQMPWLGVFVTIGYDGNGTWLEGPFERAGDRQRVERGQAVPASAEEAKSIKAPPKEDLSLAQIMRLKGIRTEIARCKLVGATRVMLTALAANLASIVIHDDDLIGQGVVKVCSNCNNNNPDFRAGREHQQQIDDFGAGVDALRWSDLLADMGSAGKVQEWLLDQPESVTDQLLAFCAAQLIELDDSTEDDMAFIARAGLDLAECWQPTGEWLAALPKAVVLRIVREVRGIDAATALEALKKDELTVEAAKLLANTGYLPEPLRTVDYKPALALDQQSIKKQPSPKSGSKSKKASKKKAAKKSVKKPAKKTLTKKTKGRSK